MCRPSHLEANPPTGIGACLTLIHHYSPLLIRCQGTEGFLDAGTAGGLGLATAQPATALVNPDKQIDCIGFFCPIPIVRTREAIRAMAGGQVLEVFSDDPAAEADMRRWAEQAGHDLLSLSQTGGVYRFLVRKRR